MVINYFNKKALAKTNVHVVWFGINFQEKSEFFRMKKIFLI